METRPKILIVDDNENLCFNMQEILEEKGYAVECAYNGKDAITISKRNCYEIILVDITLPDISSIEVVREVAKISPSTEFVYITGHSEKGVDAERTHSGKYCFGNPPMQTFVDSVPLAKEKITNGNLQLKKVCLSD